MSQEIENIIADMGKITDISGDDDGGHERRRIDIIADLNSFTHFAVQGNFVLIRTVNGRCLIEKRDVQGAPMVGFMYKAHNQIGCVSFWYNSASVQHLGPLLRNNANKRVSMQALAQ